MEVEVVQTSTGPDGEYVSRCTLCGVVIEDAPPAAACEIDKSISLDEVSFVDESISIPTMDEVMVWATPPRLSRA